METSWRMYKGVLTECVLMDIDEECEWQVKIGSKEEARETTTIDDGQNLLRENQTRAKFDKLSSVLQGAANIATSKAC